MANELYIKEFEVLPILGGNAAQIWAEPASVEQSVVAVSSTHAESAAFGLKTKFVCITCDVDISYLVGLTPTAVAGTNFPLWSKNYLCFAVLPSQKISAVLWT